MAESEAVPPRAPGALPLTSGPRQRPGTPLFSGSISLQASIDLVVNTAAVPDLLHKTGCELASHILYLGNRFF